MEPITGFCDLCIPYSKDLRDVTLMLRELVELEYKNVAIEQIYDDTKAVSKDKKSDPIPEPLKLDILQQEFQGKLKIFNRLTIIFSENAVSHFVSKSQNFRKYHVVAVIPTTETALLFACQSLSCDLITYNSDTIRLKIARKHYFEACNRNIFFEIKYSPCIVDSNERISTITKAHKYKAMGKSKNIILSSAATDRFQLRSPYDVAHLGWIFGLSEEQSKDAICGKTRRLIIAAETRRLGTSMVYVKQLNDLEMNDSDEEEGSEESEKHDSKQSDSPMEVSLVEEAGLNEVPNKKQKLS